MGNMDYISKPKLRDVLGTFLAMIGMIFTWLGVVAGGSYTSEVVKKNWEKSAKPNP